MRPDTVVKTTLLERELFATIKRIDAALLLDRKFDLRRAIDADEMEARLTRYVWSEKVQDEQATLAVEFPASLWQHIKHVVCPAWALRRWPVRTRTITSTHKFRTIALLPDFKYSAPNAEQCVLATRVSPASARFAFDDGEDS